MEAAGILVGVQAQVPAAIAKRYVEPVVRRVIMIPDVPKPGDLRLEEVAQANTPSADADFKARHLCTRTADYGGFLCVKSLRSPRWPHKAGGVFSRKPMDPRERLLGMGKLYLKRGQPIPITLLAEAEEHGLSLAEFGLPTNAVDDDGDIFDKGDRTRMTNNKAKKAIFKTPTGVAQYPWLNNPDTQFDHAGQYKVNLRLSPEDAKPLMDEVREAAAEAFGDKAKSASLPFVQDADTGESSSRPSRNTSHLCVTAQARPSRSAAAEHLRRVRDEAGWNSVPISSWWPSRHLNAAGSRAAGEAV